MRVPIPRASSPPRRHHFARASSRPVRSTSLTRHGWPNPLLQGVCNQADRGGNGYGDNLSCSKTIVAPAGSTVELTFTHIALESSCGIGGTNTGASCSNQCPEPGCDTVSVYDGPDTGSPRVGWFSGTDLPAAIESTGTSLTVIFATDTGNYGLNTAGVSVDPGFYADWHFIEHVTDVAGSGICPVEAVLTESHGTLHDDERSNVDCSQACNSNGQCAVGYGTGACTAGYADAADCSTTIHAPADAVIKFTFTQLNLELTGCHPDAGPGQGCPDGGCDFVALYDGRDANAPLLGKFSGQPLPSEMPVVVSTGQDMYVQFQTDTSNCGIAAAGQIGDRERDKSLSPSQMNRFITCRLPNPLMVVMRSWMVRRLGLRPRGSGYLPS